MMAPESLMMLPMSRSDDPPGADRLEACRPARFGPRGFEKWCDATTLIHGVRRGPPGLVVRIEQAPFSDLARPGPRVLDAFLSQETTRFHGLNELVVVTLVLVGVGRGKV